MVTGLVLIEHTSSLVSGCFGTSQGLVCWWTLSCDHHLITPGARASPAVGRWTNLPQPHLCTARHKSHRIGLLALVCPSIMLSEFSFRHPFFLFWFSYGTKLAVAMDSYKLSPNPQPLNQGLLNSLMTGTMGMGHSHQALAAQAPWRFSNNSKSSFQQAVGPKPGRSTSFVLLVPCFPRKMSIISDDHYWGKWNMGATTNCRQGMQGDRCHAKQESSKCLLEPLKP